MNAIRPPFACCMLAGLVLSVAAQAQELSLFEQTEADAAQQVAPAGPQQPIASGDGQPAYTLRSISRFGDQYQATLINRVGEVSKLAWNAGETAPVANSGFTVVAAGPSTLSLVHPPGDSCVSSATVGVSCSEGNRSELRLAVAMPLASNGTTPVMGPNQQNQGAFGQPVPVDPNNPFAAAAAQNAQGVQNGQQVFINPFSGEPEVMPQLTEEEQRERAQRQELRAGRLRQFEQQRIEDADIPPGMQRVRTPFGDRLMPIRE